MVYLITTIRIYHFWSVRFEQTNRTPFDLPEAENELIGGYHSEILFYENGILLICRIHHMFISSVVIATLYFGGYDIPFVNDATLGNSIGANWIRLGFPLHYWKSLFLHLLLHVGALDDSSFQYTPINGFRLENYCL